MTESPWACQGEALSNSGDEVELVRRAKTDPAAFGVLYERYVGKIYNYVYYRTGDYHEAEDLTARTFQRAMTHIAHYHERGVPFSAWLYRIAHNLVANWHRDRSRRPVVPLEEQLVLLPGTQHPEAVAVRRTEGAIKSLYHRTLSSLREEYGEQGEA